MIKAFLFDFDGTLVDSMPAFVKSVTDILDLHNITYEKESLVRTVTPLGADATAQYVIDLGIDMTKKDMLDSLRNNSMDAYLHSVPEKPNANNFLDTLASKGKKIYMLTANSHVQTDPCLKRLGMYSYFTQIWSCDDFNLKKTDVAIYDKAAELIGVKKEEILFFDDNPDAIKTARMAGLGTCGVYDESSRDFVNIMKENADRYVYDLGELLEEDI